MFQIDFASRVPIYEQICSNIIKLASVGVFKPGDKLPPVRILASQLGINSNTVAKAYRDLESGGYIYSTVGRGSFLSDKLTVDSAQKIIALDEYKRAAKEAYQFGVSHEEMTAILNNIFKGGTESD